MTDIHSVTGIKGVNSPLLHAITEEVFFPKGLVGFYEHKRFLLHQYQEGKYMMLESIEDTDIRFLLCPLPWDFYKTEDLVQGLISEDLDAIDEEIYAIVRCDHDMHTMNLRAPLVKKDHEMWQIVLKYTYPLDYELE